MSNNDLILDVAILYKDYSQLQVNGDNSHTITLDTINIDLQTFKMIFYPYGEQFGIDKTVVSSSSYLDSFISFLFPYRTLNSLRFDLLEEIISYIEQDLNVLRSSFTKKSIIDLETEILAIRSLSDVTSSTQNALSWSDVLLLVQNAVLSNNYNNIDNSNINAVFIVNVMFKTPTTGVKPLIIQFPYRINGNILTIQ